MSAWRQVGLNYINYSTIAAQVLRKCLKPQELVNAEKRGISNIKMTYWSEGKPIRDTKPAQ